MKKFALLFPLALTACAQPMQLDLATPYTVIAPTDKSLWLVADNVHVGTILRTDPMSWGGPNHDQNASFVKYSDYLVGKIPEETVSGVSDNVRLDKTFEVGAALPLLSHLVPAAGANLSRPRVSTVRTENSVVDETTSLLQVQIALDAAAHDTHKTQEGKELMSRLNDAGTAANENFLASPYWMVTKVYRSGTITWSTNTGLSFSANLGCGTASSALDSAVSATQHSIASATTAVTTVASRVGNAAAALRGTSSAAAPAGDGAMTTDTTGTGVTGSPAPPGSATPVSQCSLVHASGGNVATNTANGSNIIVFVQVKPVYHNPHRGTLYLPDPAPAVHQAPKVVDHS